MATSSGQVGNKKCYANYTVDKSGMGYSIITQEIKDDFNFLIEDMPNKLDEVANYIDQAANVSDAFYFENGGTVSDISEAADKMKKDIDDLKMSLADLHTAFMTDIENVNKELEYNYGWVLFGEPKGSHRTETVEEQG